MSMAQKIGTRYARLAAPKGKVPRRERALPNEFYSRGHVHGCRQCDARIENHTCTTPEEDPLCSLCQLGRDLPWWPWSSLPRECCRFSSRVLDKETRKRFLLAGTRDWYGCSECGRKHPFDPSRAENDPPYTTHQWLDRFGGPLPEPDWPHERR